VTVNPPQLEGSTHVPSTTKVEPQLVTVDHVSDELSEILEQLTGAQKALAEATKRIDALWRLFPSIGPGAHGNTTEFPRFEYEIGCQLRDLAVDFGIEDAEKQTGRGEFDLDRHIVEVRDIFDLIGLALSRRTGTVAS
jgi:hypothetical protein